ncbi:MAG: type II toxin-antitoxin system VapC family toxin [Terriglobales bacterium]
MILVDTSAWIDYLRGTETVATRALTDLIQRGEDLVTTEPIIMELLAGADTSARAMAIEQLTNGLPLLSVDVRLDFRQASAIFLAVRRNGNTVRSLVDCLIAAVALRRDVAVLHRDSDYVAIAACLPLKIHSA